MTDNLKVAWSLLAREQRKTFVGLLLIMMAMAVLETVSIGLLMPFIGIVNSPELVFQNKWLSFVYRTFGLDSPRDFLIVVGLLMVVIFILKNALQFVLQFLQSRSLLEVQMSIEKQLLGCYLSRNYAFFVERNSADLYQSIRNVSGIVSLIYGPALLASAEAIVLLLVTSFLLVVQPAITLGAVTVFGALAFMIFRFTRKRAATYGAEGSEQSVQMNKWMFQAFGGIKEVKLLAKEEFFLERSMYHSRRAAWAGLKAGVLSQITRPFIETFWFTLAILFVVIALLLGEDGKTLIPVLVLLAAAAFRIMPCITRIVNAAISIRQATYHVSTVASELDPVRAGAEASDGGAASYGFADRMVFDDISFTYSGADHPALTAVNLEIKPGESIAFVGPSGAGKTTVVDVMLGLLHWQEGEILVDGVSLPRVGSGAWRSKFGYVPQSIYLSDDTVRNNIAFGEPVHEIDEERLNAAVQLAQLAEVIEKLPLKLDTLVGDRGARLSGGQRQRIGIARALYRNPEILILDEATSALDNETEKEITKAIRTLSGYKTVVLIAHRLSTVAHCDRVFFMVDGRVEAVGRYDELLVTSEKFKRFANAV